jgi:hypothetical protein
LSRPAIESAASWSAAIQTHGAGEVRGRLVGGEAQVGGPDLDEVAPGPQPRKRQRRVGAAGDHQVQPGREMVEQELHAGLHVGRVDDVVVVEQQHDVSRRGAEVVEQADEHELDGRRTGFPQQPERVRADIGRHRAQRGDDIGPERRGIAVARVQRQPSGGGLAAGRRGHRRHPVDEQGRLAEARRRRDEHQLRGEPMVQPVAQPGPGHQATARAREEQLGLEQWGGHPRLPWRVNDGPAVLACGNTVARQVCPVHHVIHHVW